jgi:hypothetical protein
MLLAGNKIRQLFQHPEKVAEGKGRARAKEKYS